ncbi:MAG: flagellin [Syntrophomonadaceae bacterium]|nr:flagellin [Syntrophomonadaceae bacterium]
MIINHNMMAMNTHRQLYLNNAAGAKSTEKLSSGFRINRAGDDAAGLAISEKMRGQIRGLNQASRNSQDGISMIQTAEGALNETHAILQRMRELAVQSANDTNVGVDRGEIQKEINQLTSEINRIGNTTEFNTQALLKGDGKSNLAGTGIFTEEKLADGADTKYTQATSTATITEAAVADDTMKFTLNGQELTVTFAAEDNAGQSAEAIYNVTGSSATVNLAEAADANTTATGIRSALEQMIAKNEVLAGNYNVSGETANVIVTADADGDFAGAAGVIGDGVATGTVAGVNAANTGTTTAAVQASTVIDFTGITNAAGIKALLGTGMTINGQQIEFYDANAGAYKGDAIGVNLSNAIATGTAKAFVEAIVSQAGPQLEGVVLSEDTGKLAVQADTGGVAGNNITVKDGGVQEKFKANFQVGANQGQSMTIEISDMRAAALKITGAAGAEGYTSANTVTNGTNNISVEAALNVSSHESAAAAVTVINDAIENVSAMRSNLGAYQNRLEHTIKNLDASSENLQASESRVRDLDMAKEMMEFTKNNILQQAATAMLAQANNAPQSVLQLLR